MFQHAHQFTGGDLSKWSIRAATNMQNMFNNAVVFNGNVSGWITANSKVTTMSNMFHKCFLFTGAGLSEWNTGKVSNFHGLFDHNYVLDADLSKWDVSKATTMALMFRNAKVFNADLSKVGLFYFLFIFICFLGLLFLFIVVQRFVFTKNNIFVVPPTLPLLPTRTLSNTSLYFFTLFFQFFFSGKLRQSPV